MNTTLKGDLKRLKALAYHRAEWSGDFLRELHHLSPRTQKHPGYSLLETIHRWLFVPITLWPIDVDGLARYILPVIKSGRRLDDQCRFMVSLLGEPPSDSAQAVTMQHEHAVQHGRYESLIHSRHKYDFKETELAANPDFSREWQHLKKLFDIRKFQDRKKIIRRRMSEERNFRPDFSFHWKNQGERFNEVFNAFCHRWNLYGMKGDFPLLLQMTVNLTPYGTMIFIPSYWSFDPKRDFKWRTITELHRARGVPKQGIKLGMNRLSREEEGRRAKNLWQQATQAGLKGDRRIHWVMGKLGWDPRTDESRLRRLIKPSFTNPASKQRMSGRTKKGYANQPP